jgi:hypothetical protein
MAVATAWIKAMREGMATPNNRQGQRQAVVYFSFR